MSGAEDDSRAPTKMILLRGSPLRAENGPRAHPYSAVHQLGTHRTAATCSCSHLRALCRQRRGHVITTGVRLRSPRMAVLTGGAVVGYKEVYYQAIPKRSCSFGESSRAARE